MNNKMNDVVKAFHEYFQVIPADSPELLREVFRLRYHTFCVEERVPGFDTSHYPDELEMDEYDSHSSHVLLQHRLSSRFVGTVRLVLSDPVNPFKPFPAEKYAHIDPTLIDTKNLCRQQMAEISRFLVLAEFNKRRSDQDDYAAGSGNRGLAPTNRRRFPHCGLALIVGVVQMSAKHNITHWLALMEPTLNRLLSHYGAQLYQVGPAVNRCGVRMPHYVKINEWLDRMHAEYREVWELVTNYGQLYLPPVPVEESKRVMSQ